MTTITIPAAVREYLDAVLAHLGDLPEDEIDDLTIDLEWHLIEVHAEDSGSLRDRLGAPEDYADELVASAGLESAPTRKGAIRSKLAAATLTWHQAMRSAPAVRARSAAEALRPAWIAGRGWLAVAAFAVLTADVSFTHFPIPQIASSTVLGVIAVAVATAVSFAMAKQTSTRFGPAADRLFSVGTVILLLLTLGGAGDAIGRVWLVEASDYQEPSPLEQVLNIYPHDLNGTALDGVLLYDQDGNPIDLYPWVTSSTDEVRFAHDRYGQPIKNAYPIGMWQRLWDDDSDTNDRLEPVPPPRVATPDLDATTRAPTETDRPTQPQEELTGRQSE